jgi:hypothetical protein
VGAMVGKGGGTTLGVKKDEGSLESCGKVRKRVEESLEGCFKRAFAR